MPITTLLVTADMLWGGIEVALSVATTRTLAQLEIGDTAVVTSVGGEGALRQHFLDMGVIPGAQMTLVKYAPLGDPMEFLIHGYELTLRVDDVGPTELSGCFPRPPEFRAPRLG